MSVYDFGSLLEIPWQNIRKANAYIEEQKPWELAKANDTDTLADVIYNLLETIRQTAWMIRPVMPETCDKILIQLGYDAEAEKNKDFSELKTWAYLKKGQKIVKGDALFPRLDVGEGN